MYDGDDDRDDVCNDGVYITIVTECMAMVLGIRFNLCIWRARALHSNHPGGEINGQK